MYKNNRIYNLQKDIKISKLKYLCTHNPFKE